MRYTFLFTIRLCHVEADVRAAGADSETLFLRLENRTLDARALAPLLSTMLPGNALSAPVLASLHAPPPPDVSPDTFESERQSFLVRECFFVKTVVIFPLFHNALVVVAQVRQLQGRKVRTRSTGRGEGSSSGTGIRDGTRKTKNGG